MRITPGLLALILAGCGGAASSLPPGPAAEKARRHTASTPIQHIVVVVQENRTVDNLFQGFPGAYTQSYGLNAAGQQVALKEEPLKVWWDPGHSHSDWLADYDRGKLDGWNNETCIGLAPSQKCKENFAYAYVNPNDIWQYREIAKRWALADMTFQDNQGPSFPAHQYLLSGTSSITNRYCMSVACGAARRASENPVPPIGDEKPDYGGVGGCDSPVGSLVNTINAKDVEGNPVFPCFTRTSLPQELDADEISWRYYQADSGPGLWDAPDAITYTYDNDMSHVVTPSSQFIADIRNGDLASVTWITPTAGCSDHPVINTGCGPAWVASVVNAIGESQFWDSTAIFILWDDWGGWYDHVAPPIVNNYEDGFRVPLLAVSAYTPSGTISHTPRIVYGSLLKYIETTFNVASLGYDDARGDSLSDLFNYSKSPTPFHLVRRR
jgi:phospholipase C